MENKWSKYGMALVAGIPVALCLSVVCCGTSSLPADILEDDWRWMYGCGVLSLAGLALLVLLFPKRVKECLSAVVSWVFILYGGIEAVWGIRQVYGFTYSNHSLYALTGSFYNPGPYSGYLAMIFPVCLHEWLERKEHKKTVPYYIAIAGMLLILCVLPAGMSRSAWIAAAVSFIYVCGMHYKMEIQHYIRHHRKQAVSFAIVTFILGGIALGGIYQMKKDSADGRLFMWKIAAQAVSEHPWTGCGWNSVPAAYGQAQENYFAAGNYTATEELVAGAPLPYKISGCKIILLRLSVSSRNTVPSASCPWVLTDSLGSNFPHKQTVPSAESFFILINATECTTAQNKGYYGKRHCLTS